MSKTPDKQTEDTGKSRTLLLACGALAHEVKALITMNNLNHMSLHCLPAQLHIHPEKIPGEVEKAVHKFRDAQTEIFVLYADCGTGGLLEKKCKELGVQMLEGPHCYSFFDGNEKFAAREEYTAFYLTDFLVRQFDAFVWRPLGLDKHPELRETYFGNYETLVYLAQLENPELVELAREAADRLGLAFEHRVTGYGDLATALITHSPHA